MPTTVIYMVCMIYCVLRRTRIKVLDFTLVLSPHRRAILIIVFRSEVKQINSCCEIFKLRYSVKQKDCKNVALEKSCLLVVKKLYKAFLPPVEEKHSFQNQYKVDFSTVEQPLG